ncbi:NAD(P)-dependent alcohol dehydrogenase [Microbacterium tumbae]
MRAAVVDRFGPPDVIEIAEVPVPDPREDEVLVRVTATAVTAADSRMRAARFPSGFGVIARPAIGFRGPRMRILGNSLSGIVERVGAGVKRFAPGDEVAGMTGGRMRGHAEFAVVPVHALARKPDRVSHVDAAGILFGGTTALFFLRDRAKLSAGETVLVNGAAGSVGSAAVQLARHFHATVTATASARNAVLVRRLGADRAIDYATMSVAALDESFDVVLDAVGTLAGGTGQRLLTDEGRLLLVAAGLSDTIRAAVRGRGRIFAGVTPERADDIALLLSLLASGRLDAVTEVAGGLEALPEAHRVVDSGHKIGNLVVLPHGGAA